MANFQSLKRIILVRMPANRDGTETPSYWAGRKHQLILSTLEDSSCFALWLFLAFRAAAPGSRRICLCSRTTRRPTRSGILEPLAVASTALHFPKLTGQKCAKFVIRLKVNGMRAQGVNTSRILCLWLTSCPRRLVISSRCLPASSYLLASSSSRFLMWLLASAAVSKFTGGQTIKELHKNKQLSKTIGTAGMRLVIVKKTSTSSTILTSIL